MRRSERVAFWFRRLKQPCSYQSIHFLASAAQDSSLSKCQVPLTSHRRLSSEPWRFSRKRVSATPSTSLVSVPLAMLFLS
eukprot:13755460-Alexandrium_andersonii.AAC.1